MAIYEKSSASVTAVTYGGVALTRVGRTLNDSSVELWRLTAPAVGTATVTSNDER